MARRNKALLQNDNAGGNRPHRDHRTHRVNNLPKKKHDRFWKQKREQRLEKRYRRHELAFVEDSLSGMTEQEL